MSRKRDEAIRIEIDGEEYEAEEQEMTVGALLGLVDLDPADCYLIELAGQSEQQIKHRDAGEAIKLRPNMRFVTGDCAPAKVA